MSDEIKIKYGPTLPCVGYESNEPPTELQSFFRGCGVVRLTSMAPCDFDREQRSTAQIKKEKE